MSLLMKRLSNEIKLLHNEPLSFCEAYHSPNDIMTWFFLVKRTSDTLNIPGFFLGKMSLPEKYPTESPNFIIWTPNCLSYQKFHDKCFNYQTPAQNIRSYLLDLCVIISDCDNDKYHMESYDWNMCHYEEIFTNEKFKRIINESYQESITIDI